MRLSLTGSLLPCLGAAALIAGCASAPPSNPQNLCSVFQEKDSWYVAAHEVHNKYGVPIHTAMAILFQESGFAEGERPDMRWFLFIPYGRGSSDSEGYVHPDDALWARYVDEAGSWFSDKTDFADALDFIGWYMQQSSKLNGIAYSDAYNQYLNYYEGWQDYAAGSYENKDWLMTSARQVAARADLYRQQLLKCDLY